MDPARKGADNKFLNTLLETEPKRIVYVSCDPATLARDLKVLSSKYDIISVTPVDMFPQTFHVETVALLTLNPSVKK
jgi:23S rRNA (uracil1939-C5)-methyltransferase